MAKKTRIDELLVEKGLIETRSKAKATVLSGSVFVNGQKITKAGEKFSDEVEILIKQKEHPFVSRGGLKLQKALDHFKIDPKDWNCMDIGASTGGFCDCLLRSGANKIVAVDVGYGQFAYKLRQDQRIHLFERQNIRHFELRQIPEDVRNIKLFVMDLSFISLKLIFPLLRNLSQLNEEIHVLCLVKPQFELGKGEVGKGGIVKDPEDHKRAIQMVNTYAENEEFHYFGTAQSPIFGAKGNIEFLSHYSFLNEK